MKRKLSKQELTLKKIAIAQQAYIDEHIVEAVITLDNTPTSSTITYTKDDQTIDFKIGQFVRVADAQATEGYVFYQLYDLVTEQDVITAIWVEAKYYNGIAAYYDPQQEAVVFPIDGQAVYDPQQQSINILI